MPHFVLRSITKVTNNLVAVQPLRSLIDKTPYGLHARRTKTASIATRNLIAIYGATTSPLIRPARPQPLNQTSDQIIGAQHSPAEPPPAPRSPRPRPVAPRIQRFTSRPRLLTNRVTMILSALPMTMAILFPNSLMNLHIAPRVSSPGTPRPSLKPHQP